MSRPIFLRRDWQPAFHLTFLIVCGIFATAVICYCCIEIGRAIEREDMRVRAERVLKKGNPPMGFRSCMPECSRSDFREWVHACHRRNKQS